MMSDFESEKQSGNGEVHHDVQVTATSHQTAGEINAAELAEQIKQKKAEIARLNELIRVAKSAAKAPTNEHLKGVAPDDILSVLPKDFHVGIFSGTEKIADFPAKFIATKKGKVGVALRSKGAFKPVTDGGLPTAYSLQFGVIIPIGLPPKPVKDAKKKKRTRQEVAA